MFHMLTANKPAGDVSYETDRLRFIGRGRTTADPQALHDEAALSGSAGPVLDPVAAIRCCIALDADETATVDLISGIGETREACLGLAGKYRDMECVDRALTTAPAFYQAVLNSLHITAEDAQLYARLAGSVIYANAALRADPGILARNLRGQSSLWSYAISGDLPIVLLKIADPANIDLLRQLVQAHAYWRAHGLAVDLVIISEESSGHRSISQDLITQLIAAGNGIDRIDQPGGIFLRAADKVDDGDRILLQTVARVVMGEGGGLLAQQLEKVRAAPIPAPAPRVTLDRGLGSPRRSHYLSAT